MRKIMMAMAAMGLSSGVAWGQGAATQSVALSANVGTYCTIGGLSTGTAGRTGVATGMITSQRVGTGGNLTISGTQGTVACTSNATITLTSASGGLSNTTAAGLSAAGAAGAFTNKIHYSAQASYNGQTAGIDTSPIWTQTAVTATSPTTSLGAQTAGVLALTVDVKPTAVGRLLAGGDYLDTLTVTLTPTP